MTEQTNEQRRTFRAMATDVTLRVVQPSPHAVQALDRAEAVFRRVEAACTRFDPASPLMRANGEPSRWHDVPFECAQAVDEASRAHRETGGVFDPRVLDALVNLGYGESRSFAPDVLRPAATSTAGARAALLPDDASRRPWRPRVEHLPDGHRILLDGARIDLGGIGKGLAVRWAAEELARAGGSVLVEAGGDCQLTGDGPAGAGWQVGMEDPFGGAHPLAVLALRDMGCATSSVRLRRWFIDGREVHHLIDPRTGLSGGQGLAAVTVLHPDVAWAEVWSKALFLLGPARIADAARVRGLAALWVEADGRLQRSDAAHDFLVWEASNVPA